MFKSLLKSAEPVSKQVASLLQHFQNNTSHKFIINQDIKLQNFSGIKGLGIVAHKAIPNKEKIFSVSASQALTGFEIIDANTKVNERLSEIAEQVSKKYHENNESQYYNTVNILKIVFQMIVQQNDPNLSVHHYAKFLYENSPTHVPLSYPEFHQQYIFSKHLKSLIQAQKMYLQSILDDLHLCKLSYIQYEQLLKCVGVIRSRSINFLPHDPKSFDKNTYLMVCPLADLVNHSFTPNCRFEGHYNSIENDSFVELRALEDILPGEELTVNYGDLSNYDYLMKFGFLNDNNPFDEYLLNLDYGKVLDYTGQLFDLKQKILSLIPNVQLETVKIFKNRIDSNMLTALRIFFLTEEDVKHNPLIYSYVPKDFKSKINDAHERRIFQFIVNNIQEELETLHSERDSVINTVNLPNQVEKEIFYDIAALKRNQSKINDDVISSIIQISLEEEITLKKNLEFCINKLKSLSS